MRGKSFQAVSSVVVTSKRLQAYDQAPFRHLGIDCAHTIREQHPDTGVVVLSAHDDAEYGSDLIRVDPVTNTPLGRFVLLPAAALLEVAGIWLSLRIARLEP